MAQDIFGFGGGFGAGSLAAQERALANSRQYSNQNPPGRGEGLVHALGQLAGERRMQKAENQRGELINTSVDLARTQAEAAGEEIPENIAQARGLLLAAKQLQGMGRHAEARELWTIGTQQIQEARDANLNTRQLRANAEEAEARSLENTRKIALDMADGSLVHFDNGDGTFTTLNLDRDEHVRMYQRMTEEQGMLPMTSEQRYNLDRDQRKALVSSMEGLVERRKARERVVGALDLMDSVNQFAGVLADTPNALMLGGEASGKINQVITTIADVGRRLGKEEGWLAENRDVERQFFEANEAYSRSQAMITDLAYMIARARDSGGRLSDQDFEYAKSMIGADGQPNPAVIMSVLRDRLDMAMMGVDNMLGVYTPDRQQELFGDSYRKLNERREQFERYAEQVVAWHERETGSSSPQAETPGTPGFDPSTAESLF